MVDYFRSLAPPAPQTVIARLDAIDRRLDAIDRRHAQSNQWNAARAANSAAIRGDDDLIPLQVITRDANGEEALQDPDEFPATKDDFLRLTAADMNRLLQAYNLPNSMALEQKRRALAAFIGIRLPGV